MRVVSALVSSTETRAAERKIRSAATLRFGRGNAALFYEHGQWWAEVASKGDPRTFSVVDAVPGVDGTGIDFELL